MLLRYELVNERFAESMSLNAAQGYQVLTAPNENYRIYFGADSHVGGTNNLARFFIEAQQDGVAAVVVGDLCTGKAADYQLYDASVPQAYPVFHSVGNHDLYFNGWPEFKSRFGSSVYWFSVITPSGTDVFLSLDSGSGTLGDKQLAWVQDFLQHQRKFYRRCIVFSHVNFLRIRNTTSTNLQADEVHVLLNLFAQHQVDMVINGHDHKRNVKQLGNTTYLTLDALLDGYKKASYMVLSVQRGVLKHEFIQL